MVFGIKKVELKRELDRLYDRVSSYVRDEIFRPLSDKDQELEDHIDNLETRLKQYNSENAKLDDIRLLREGLAKYGTRLSELEESQRRTGIVYEAVQPKGEITFEDVRCLAQDVSDTAYQRIRDYFLLEMAKKGFEGERPDFAMWNRDSSLAIQFLVTDIQQSPQSGQGWYAGFDSSRAYKTQLYLENIPKLEEGTSKQKEKVMFSKERFNYRDEYFLLRVSSDSKTDWAEKLREELPELLQAYMLGYSLKCLDERRFDTALEVQKKHGLKENLTLLARMSEIMLVDPNLAAQFVAHYPSTEQ